jgi:hypothetical protein
MDQIRDARKYMEKKLKDTGSSDLILFAGDFNVNGHQENSIVAEYREQLEIHVSNKFINDYSRNWHPLFTH